MKNKATFLASLKKLIKLMSDKQLSSQSTKVNGLRFWDWEGKLNGLN